MSALGPPPMSATRTNPARAMWLGASALVCLLITTYSLDGLVRTAEQARGVARQSRRETDGSVQALEFWAVNCIVCWTAAQAPVTMYQTHRYCTGNKDPGSRMYWREKARLVQCVVETVDGHQVSVVVTESLPHLCLPGRQVSEIARIEDTSRPRTSRRLIRFFFDLEKHRVSR